MNNKKYKCLIVEENNGVIKNYIGESNINELPEGEVLIKVLYSSLNYKDALSASGNKGVTKKFPHTPGIDAAGIIEYSSNNKFKEREEVLVTGYDLGMNTKGGFGEYIRVPSSWVVKLPNNLSLLESMIYGTAGFTAALSIYKLEQNGLIKNDGTVLVTGATGGVGSLAVALLKNAGYNVTASTGKNDKSEFLKMLGADEIISREETIDNSGKPLSKGRWNSVIDTVGGNILSSAIASTKMFGSVASCGLTLSPKIETTVYPFILRGVNLLGINSAETPMELREKIWEKLSGEWKISILNSIYKEVTLEEIPEQINLILNGKITGRVVLKHG